MTFEIVSGMFGAGAVMISAGNRFRRVSPAEARTVWIKYFSYAVIVGGIILCTAQRVLLVAVLLAIAARCLQEVLRLGAHAAAYWVLISLGFALATGNFLTLYLIVAANDAFAQLGGRLFGGPKIWPRLSPGKTLSGALCGITGAVAMAVLLGLLPQSGLALAIAGQAGDLAASKIKRRAGVKDFDDSLPGQGGFMDRFDSLWGAAPLGVFLC